MNKVQCIKAMAFSIEYIPKIRDVVYSSKSKHFKIIQHCDIVLITTYHPHTDECRR